MLNIYSNDGLLTLDNHFKKATVEEYNLADRCIGSIFDEVLKEGEIIILADGGGTKSFILDHNLDLVLYKKFKKVGSVKLNGYGEGYSTTHREDFS